ncbi:MAG: 50S ribosomal protein L22 [Candidatus Vogelbacteria bacterium]|nr:50S ribosomal protein L22 [Candidatus Vogelbacteria bacterium]
MTLVNAELNRYNQSPRKVRLLAELIKGKKVDVALAILSVSAKRGSLPMIKLVRSAIANAKNNFKLDQADLYVKEARVDGGVVMKRGRARAFGRSFPIRRKTSKVKLVLDTLARQVKK